jgi:hypothetical protein
MNYDEIHERANDAIAGIIDYIRALQNPDGSFGSLSSPSVSDFSSSIPYVTTFFASSISLFLSSILSQPLDFPAAPARSRALTIIENISSFLNRERSEAWSFNYYRRSGGGTSSFYADDLDDTSLALAALYRERPTLFSGEVMASIAKMLIAQERQPGGPYRTWVAPLSPASRLPLSPDPAVNANIGYFLAQCNVHAEGLDAYLKEIIRTEQFSSPFYPAPCHLIYFLSRYACARGSEAAILNALKKAALQRLHAAAAAGPPSLAVLESSMLVSAISWCGCSEEIPHAALDLILGAAEAAAWRPEAFCIDPLREGTRRYAGSPSLTACAAGEALALFMSAHSRHSSQNTDDAFPSFILRCKAIARKQFPHASKQLSQTVSHLIEAASDAALPRASLELQAIFTRLGRAMQKEMFEQLMLAALYGWIAYSVYDDLLDGEAVSALLPPANLFLSKSSTIYGSLAARHSSARLRDFFAEQMAATASAEVEEIGERSMDGPAASSWMPQIIFSSEHYYRSASRSAGYLIAPLSQMLIAGYPPHTPEFDGAEAILTHYLIGRQIHDDAHDWEDDLARGHITGVLALLLKNYRERYPAKPPRSMQDALGTLRELFWMETIEGVDALIRAHIASARQARSSVGIFNEAFMEIELSALEEHSLTSVAERNRIAAFLSCF